MPKDYFDEGRIAAANGRPESGNPYQPGTDAWEQWRNGYAHYHSVDEDGEYKDDD